MPPKKNQVAPGSKGDSDKGNRPTSAAAGAKKGKKGKKGKKAEIDYAAQLEDENRIRVPESVLPVALTEEVQLRLRCVVNEDVTRQRPFAFVKKVDLCNETRRPDCEPTLAVAQTQVEKYQGRDLMVMWDPNAQYGQSFYLVLSAKQRAMECKAALAALPKLTRVADYCMLYGWAGGGELAKLHDALLQIGWDGGMDMLSDAADMLDPQFARVIEESSAVLICLTRRSCEKMRTCHLIGDGSMQAYTHALNTLPGRRKPIPVVLEEFTWPDGTRFPQDAEAWKGPLQHLQTLPGVWFIGAAAPSAPPAPKHDKNAPPDFAATVGALEVMLAQAQQRVPSMLLYCDEGGGGGGGGDGDGGEQGADEGCAAPEEEGEEGAPPPHKRPVLPPSTDGGLQLVSSHAELLWRAWNEPLITITLAGHLDTFDEAAFRSRLSRRLSQECHNEPTVHKVRGAYELVTAASNCTLRVEVDKTLQFQYRSSSSREGKPTPVGIDTSSDADKVVMWLIRKSWPKSTCPCEFTIRHLEEGSVIVHAKVAPHLGLMVLQLAARGDPELMAMGVQSVVPHPNSPSMCSAMAAGRLCSKKQAIERITALMDHFGMLPSYIHLYNK